jgi:hypothetical protein
VRRITKDLPDGKEIGVVTDLWDEVKYPAEAMLSTYQSRWGIEISHRHYPPRRHLSRAA